jgi:hypothetical protein
MPQVQTRGRQQCHCPEVATIVSRDNDFYFNEIVSEFFLLIYTESRVS